MLRDRRRAGSPGADRGRHRGALARGAGAASGHAGRGERRAGPCHVLAPGLSAGPGRADHLLGRLAASTTRAGARHRRSASGHRRGRGDLADVRRRRSVRRYLGLLPPPLAHRLTPVVWPTVPDLERTLVLVKPDAVARGLTGEIISRLERKGLKLAALEQRTLDRAVAE